MPGFDAVGKLALGQLPLSGTPFGFVVVPSPPIRIRVSSFDKSISLNPNLFKNNIPNNQYGWPAPHHIRQSAVVLDSLFNLNLFKNPIPFLNQATSFWRVSNFIPSSNPYNQNLYTVVVTTQPFNQYDWPRITRLCSVFDQTQAFNPNLFTNPLPFNQTDWSRPVRIAGFDELPAIGINPNVFTNPMPFSVLAQPSSARRAFTQAFSGFNPNLSIVVTTVPILNFASTITYRFRISLPDNSIGFLITRPVTPPPPTTLIQRTLTGVGL